MDISAVHLSAVLLGKLYYRRWFSREPLDDHALEGVDHVIDSLLAGHA